MSIAIGPEGPSPVSFADVGFVHVDVFAEAPYSGNSLPVFLNPGPLAADQMLLITQELRHFEAVFLTSTAEPSTWRARVFDLFGELGFAGHPLLGAAAVLHQQAPGDDAMGARTWRIELPGRTVTVVTRPSAAGSGVLAGGRYVAELDQGEPEFGDVVDARARVAHSFALDPTDLRDDLPLQVVSTGLRYLIVPVRRGALERARVVEDLTGLVASVGAEFAVLFDEASLEMRHWNNDGVMEDVATGSAAGAIGAYRLRHALVGSGEEFELHQGRHLGRPSVLTVRGEGTSDQVHAVTVSGTVVFVGHGVVQLPSPRPIAPPASGVLHESTSL